MNENLHWFYMQLTSTTVDAFDVELKDKPKMFERDVLLFKEGY